jgi:hypothetical protein
LRTPPREEGQQVLSARPDTSGPNRHEDDILLHCALRFDGKAYLRDTAFDPAPLLATYIASGDWPEDVEDLHLLAAFHVLQRRLTAWGAPPTPRDGKAWYVFRALFFEVATLDVPPRYRSARGWALWLERYAPRIAGLLAHVQAIHESTHYREEALGIL